jgi:hypothetical protein
VVVSSARRVVAVQELERKPAEVALLGEVPTNSSRLVIITKCIARFNLQDLQTMRRSIWPIGDILATVCFLLSVITRYPLSASAPVCSAYVGVHHVTPCYVLCSAC